MRPPARCCRGSCRNRPIWACSHYPTEVIEIGQARCLIRRFLHGPGGDLNPFNQATDECQRTGPDATVFAYVEGAESSTAQRQVVELTDAAFTLIR